MSEAPRTGGAEAGRATIDGRPVTPERGETILEAARRIGVELPGLCFVPGLPPEGGCRLCLVRLGEGGPLKAACHTACEPGMAVVTGDPELRRLRRDLLALTLSSCAPDRLAPRRNRSEVERLMADLEVHGSPFGHSLPAAPPDESHPYLRFDPGLCITCRRCVNLCEGVQGEFVFGVAGRGGGTRLILGPDDTFAASRCTACGACVESCPTGALSDVDRLPGETPSASTDTVCGYCGVGCRVRVARNGGRVLAIAGVPGAAVNRGHTCAKGRYAHAYHFSPERLTRPLLRVDGRLEPIGWEEAIDWAASRLRTIRERHGPEALGVMTSSRSTNEAAYLFQKLFRTLLGTNNVDCCARVCHSSTALALQLVTGTGAASASYSDIDRARLIVVAGANPTEAHPVVGARIKQAVLRGARLIVIDPRRIELAEYADLHLPLRPGTNVALFNGLAKVMIEEELYDAAYVAERTEGFEALAELCRRSSLRSVGALCRLPVAKLRAAARLLGSGPALFVHGLGLSELTQGTASVMALCNLGMLGGSIGRPGAGMLPLRGQNNVQGNADMGGMPNQVTGYQPLDDPEVRARLDALWGAPPPREAGLTIPEMIDAAAAGHLRGLWIQGEDVVQSDPQEEHVREALEALDLLIVQELFPTGTTEYAHLVLPAAGALEQHGTFTNGERRIQLVRPAVPAPGEARPDWRVAVDLARALGAGWSYPDAGAVMAEIARAAPRLFGGVDYARLEGDGLQWPCPDGSHPGTARVHGEGFLRGRGRLAAVDFEAAPEHDVEGFPFLLVTGRVLQHYNVGTMTRRTANRRLTPADLLEIHPRDATRLGLAEGQRARVESRWGETAVPVHITRRVEPGTLFLSFHFPETHANRLVGPHRDPSSNCPDYKVVAVRLAAAG